MNYKKLLFEKTSNRCLSCSRVLLFLLNLKDQRTQCFCDIAQVVPGHTFLLDIMWGRAIECGMPLQITFNNVECPLGTSIADECHLRIGLSLM